MSLASPKTGSADSLLEKLSVKYAAPEWAVIPQVRDATGFAGCRTADAIAMSLWPSRGLYLHGFEIKVSRSDWMRELKNPAKADTIAEFCEFWWIVALKDVVKDGELPPPWGLLIPSGSGLTIAKAAVLTPAKNPDKPFLAAILRRATQVLTPQAKFDALYQEGVEDGIKRGLSKAKFQDEDIERLQTRLKTFEQQSGVRIDSWNGAHIGEAVRLVLNGEGMRVREDLDRLLGRAKQIVSDIERELTGERR